MDATVEVSSQQGLFEPQEFEFHRLSSSRPAGRETGEVMALLCLSRDEAEFIDAAAARLLHGDDLVAAVAAHVDCKLWEMTLSVRNPSGRRQDSLASAKESMNLERLYKAGISAVQSHCLRTYGLRFQALATLEQDAVLALLESGEGFGGIGLFQILSFVLVNDAAEAYFKERRPSPLPAAQSPAIA